MRIVRFIIAAAASSAAVAQQAPPPPPQPPITVTGQIPDADKPLCKYVETGSLIPKKVCMPKSEWARAQSDTDGAMKTMRDWQRVRCNMGTRC